MKLAFGLFALAAAQDGAQADDSQQSQGAHRAKAHRAPDAGYGQQESAPAQKSYGGQESYGEASYGEPAYGGYPAAVEQCTTPCPVEAPCLGAGGCHAKVGIPQYAPQYEAHYAAPVQSYGAQQSYGGQQAQQSSGYRQLQNADLQCPPGTNDTSGWTLTSNFALWIGFALLFIPAGFFLCSMFGDIADDGKINGSNTWRHDMGMHRIVAGFICLIASLAYLTMATGHGFIVRCCDGRSFFYARYIDWTLTTPMMIWELFRISQKAAISFNAVVEENAQIAVLTTTDLLFLIFMDILMIIAGLIGSLICGSAKWAFFGFSILTFIPILVTLCQWDNTAHSSRLNSANLSTPNAGDTAQSQLRRYRNAMTITVITWFFYPIVWIMAEGTGSMSANAEAICYTVLDVLAKSIFGFIVLRNLASEDPDTSNTVIGVGSSSL